MSKQPHKHAYMIIAHQDLPLLQTLVEMLDDIRNDIYVYIDKKWVDFPQNSLQTRHARLTYVANRKNIYWGHTSIIEATLALMHTASSQEQYAYYHLLSGSDLPIKTQDYIHNYFAIHQGKEFVILWSDSSHRADARYKVERYHFGMRYEKGLPLIPSILLAKLRFGISNLLYSILGSRISDNEHIYKGSEWFSITNHAIQYILQKQDFIKHKYRFTRCGDEIFIPTTLMNSPIAEHIFPKQGTDPLRYMDWVNNAPSPKVLTMEHQIALRESPCLFARKFSSYTDAEIISWIRETFSSVE